MVKIKIINENIYIVIREYSDFHMETVDVEHGITIGEARRLRNELDEAINKIEETTCCGTRSRDRE